MDETLFKKLVDRIAAAWRVKLEKATITEWWEAFRDLPYAESEEALNRLIRSTERMPGNILPAWLGMTNAVMKENGWFERDKPEQTIMPEGTANPARPYNRAWHLLSSSWQILGMTKMRIPAAEDPPTRQKELHQFAMVSREIRDLAAHADELMPKPTTENPDPEAPPQLVALALAAQERVRVELFGEATK